MKILLIAILSLWSFSALAQESILTIQQANDYALKNNSNVRAAVFEVESQRQLKKTSFDLSKTDVTLLYGQYNSYAKNDNNITVSQSIPFTALGSQGALNRSLLASSELKKAASENELVYQVKQLYHLLALAYSQRKIFLQQDSIFEGFFKAAALRNKTGETNLLEQTTAEVQRNEAKNKLRQNESDIAVLRSQLQTVLNSPTLPDIQMKELSELQLERSVDTTTLLANPSLAYSRQQIEVARSQKKVESAKFAPDLLIGFFNQTLIGTPDAESGTIAFKSDRFSGFQVGVSIPLWFVPHQGRVRAAEFSRQAAKSKYEFHQRMLMAEMNQAMQQYQTSKNSLEYYRNSALPNAELILKQSQAAFRGGEIGYAEYLLGLKNAISIKESYLQTLNEYNQRIIFIEYLLGNK